MRYKLSEANEEDNIGNYRLSSLSTQKTADAIRDEKLTKLSQDLRDKVERKKLQLELVGFSIMMDLEILQRTIIFQH